MQRIDVVAAVIIRDGRILLTQRKRGKALEYKWCCPGGQIENDESPHRALTREILEEVDAEFVVARPCDFAPVSVRAVNGAKTFTVWYYTAPLASDSREPRPMEGQGLGWFTANDLEQLELTPADETRREELVALVRGSQ
jgi:ADP-ribose pyrophosphatase YjhB (NUDIX family)